MEVHQKVVHEKKKPYKCELCEYTAGQKSSLVHHMNWVHEHKKPYACKLEIDQALFLSTWLVTHNSTMSRDVPDIHGDQADFCQCR